MSVSVADGQVGLIVIQGVFSVALEDAFQFSGGVPTLGYPPSSRSHSDITPIRRTHTAKGQVGRIVHRGVRYVRLVENGAYVCETLTPRAIAQTGRLCANRTFGSFTPDGSCQGGSSRRLAQRRQTGHSTHIPTTSIHYILCPLAALTPHLVCQGLFPRPNMTTQR